MPPSEIILSTPEQLSEFKVLESDLLSDLPDYKVYLPKCQSIFNAMLTGNSSRIDARPYQPEYAALMLARPLNIMGYAQGTGKTNISIIAALALCNDNPSQLPPASIQIAVPNLLAAQRWIEDGDRFINWADNYQVLKSFKDLKEITKPIVIYSHDLPKRIGKRQSKGSSEISGAAILANFKPILFIIDELHELANNTLRTQTLRLIRLSHEGIRVLGLSGTLSDGDLSQVHNTCKFIYDDHWPFDSSSTFTKRFGVKMKLKTNYLYGSREMQEDTPERYLHLLDKDKLVQYYNLMRRFVHRVTLDEPQVAQYAKRPQTKVVIHSLLPNDTLAKAYSHYVETRKEVLTTLANSDSHDVKHRAQALQLIYPLIQLCNHTAAHEKRAEVLRIIQQAPAKVAIFCQYVDSARILHNDLMKELGKKAVVRIYAQDPQANPKVLSKDAAIQLINRYQYDSSVKVGIFSCNLASQSIDLTASSDVIQYCLSWSSKKLQQSITRAVRPGNRLPFVTIHYLYHEGLIDEHQVHLATKKIEASKMIMDYDLGFGNSNPFTDDLSPSEIAKRLLSG